MFGRKPRLKQFQLGLFLGVECVCGYAGVVCPEYLDNDIPGYEPGGLVRCWDCGRVYTWPEGRYIETRYTGPSRVDNAGVVSPDNLSAVSSEDQALLVDPERRGSELAYRMVVAQSDTDVERGLEAMLRLFKEATDDETQWALVGFMWVAHTVPSVCDTLRSTIDHFTPEVRPVAESALRVAETGDFELYDIDEVHAAATQISLLNWFSRVCAIDGQGRSAIEAGYARGSLVVR